MTGSAAYRYYNKIKEVAVAVAQSYKLKRHFKNIINRQTICMCINTELIFSKIPPFLLLHFIYFNIYYSLIYGNKSIFVTLM